jgi:hypothetical protein
MDETCQACGSPVPPGSALVELVCQDGIRRRVCDPCAPRVGVPFVLEASPALEEEAELEEEPERCFECGGFADPDQPCDYCGTLLCGEPECEREHHRGHAYDCALKHTLYRGGLL